MHDGTGKNLERFEDILFAYKPMISACIRKLNIYKNYDTFRQAGYIALWKAWLKYDATKGDFAPFAYRTIYGALLDELKKEHLNEERFQVIEEEQLSNLLENDKLPTIEHDQLSNAIRQLSVDEKELLRWLFVEEISLKQAATMYGITVSGIKKRRERLICKMRSLMGRG
ncbi:MAG: sigma-70 family RNA polymerase sigma factor [Psychrobacillus sp.]